jgi:hypothetical protein
MKIGLLLFGGFASTLAGQTTVYLPAVGATSCQVTAASSATPSQITCANHGFSSGNVIAIFASNGGGSAPSLWSAGWIVGGLRKVAGVVDGNNFTITDISGTNIPGPSSFSCAATTYATVTNRLGCRAVLLTAYTTKSHPRVFGLDGSSGTLTTALKDTSATGRANTANAAWYALQTIEGNFYTGVSGQGNAYNQYTPDYSNVYAFPALSALNWLATGNSQSLTEAKYPLVNNPLDVIRGNAGCNTSVAFCGQRLYDSDYSSLYMPYLALNYSLIRGQLTSGQRSAFANAMLNDNTHAADGIDSVQCTNQGMTLQSGTITSVGAAIIGIGTHFTSFNVGDWISPNYSGQYASGDYGTRIVSITDDTHMTGSITTYNYVSTPFDWAPQWTSGNCGLVWFAKHHTLSPFSDSTNYGSGGGTAEAGEANLTITKVYGYMTLALALADDDPRAVELLALSAAYYYDQILYPYAQMNTGIGTTAPYYYWDRDITFMPLMALEIKNGISSGPDYTQAVYPERSVSLPYFLAYPGQQEDCFTYGEGGQCTTDLPYSTSWSLIPYMYPSYTESPYLTYWFRNSGQKNAWQASFLQGSSGNQLMFHYVFGDPQATQTNFTSIPTQHVWKDTDYSICATFGYLCSSTKAYGFAISRTGWTSANDTFMLYDTRDLYSGDHSSWFVSGAVHIYRKQILLGGDNTNGASGGCCGPGTGVSDMAPELGGQSNFPSATTAYQASPILRWSGTDPTGDSASRYMYIMSDLSGQYVSGVSRAQRHVLHFKKSGAQDYIVQYDDFALSSPSTIKTYLHFFINGQQLPGGVTYNSGTNSWQSRQSSAVLNTTVLFPGGTGTTLVDNANGSYTNGYGKTFRGTVCAGSSGTCSSAATTGEWLIVHEPINGTSGSMATLTQPAAANFRVLQIADSTTPKVAAFATGGNTFSSVIFTTTHSGTAQYLIAGLSAGTYTVTVNGAAVASNQSVVNGDNTLYFESTSGTISIVGTGTTLSACDLNGDGVVNIQDVSIMVGVAQGSPTCAPRYDLNQDGQCNVMDVQRILTAGLGLGCKTGQ